MLIVHDTLELDGPRVRILVIHPNDPSREDNLVAEIDTGTWLTGLDPRTVEKLGLVELGKVDAHSTGSHETTKQGMVRARLKILMEAGSWLDLGERICSVHPVEPFRSIQALVGRNVLAGFVFTYDGPNQTYELVQPEKIIEKPGASQDVPVDQGGESKSDEA